MRTSAGPVGIEACGKFEGNHPLAMLRLHAFYGLLHVLTIFGKGFPRTRKFALPVLQVAHTSNTMWMLYVRRLVGAQNGRIGPNSPAGPVRCFTCVMGSQQGNLELCNNNTCTYKCPH